jgi:hypothetical protein
MDEFYEKSQHFNGMVFTHFFASFFLEINLLMELEYSWLDSLKWQNKNISVREHKKLLTTIEIINFKAAHKKPFAVKLSHKAL